MSVEDAIVTSALAETKEPSSVRQFFSELLRSGTGLIGLIVLSTVVVASALAPWISPKDPAAQDLRARFKPPLLFGGTSKHIFGTDSLGRDLFSRVLYGGRTSLFVAVCVVLIAGTFGILMGLIAGYRGKLADALIMRLADMQLAFPGILLALVILYALGANVKLVIIVLAINGWMVYARITRSLVLTLRSSEYIEAAELSGAGPARVILSHILPNLTSPLLTLGVLEFARIILAEAALSFLGYGIQSPGTSWGLIIAQGQDYLSTAWWLVTVPGTVICLTVLSANLFASWLRIYADPRQREKQLSRQLDSLVVDGA
jgi:peptide/nickel transport system permease protein